MSYLMYELQLEAVIQRCPVKKMFLEISQDSQENTCAGLCKIFMNTYYEEHLQTTASKTCSNFIRTALFR